MQDAAPDFQGRLNPKLERFLTPLGRKHREHPPQPDWIKAEALEAIAHVVHQP